MVFTAFIAAICLAIGMPSLFFGIVSLDVGVSDQVMTAIGLFAAMGAYGLWKNQNWGFNLTALLYVSIIPLSLYGIYLDDSASSLGLHIASIIIALSVIYFMGTCLIRSPK